MTPTPSNSPTQTPQSTACPGLTPTRTPSATPTSTSTSTSIPVTPTTSNSPTLTPTKTPTNTPGPCICSEYLVTNDNNESVFLQYIACNGTPTTEELEALSAVTLCACDDSILPIENVTISYLNPCPTPTPTPTITKTPTTTPTPSLTSNCFLSWNINECTLGTCSGGICACEGSTPITVYTECGVTDITNNDTQIYDTSSLTSPFTGDFVDGGSIYSSDGSSVTLVCVVGGPC